MPRNINLLSYYLLFSLTIWSGGTPAQTLNNGGFEGSFGTTADGWYDITYGTPEYPDVAYSSETATVHGGASAQKITVNDLGDGASLLVQILDFPAGRTYRGSVWLRSESPMTVAFYFQERVPYYWVPSVDVVDVDTTWQQVTINGGFDRDIPEDNTIIPGRFVVEPLTPGELFIDDATFTDISEEVWNAPVTLADSIPASYFGMHVNKLGVHETWPATNHGTMRLWNTGTTWEIMEPYQGALEEPQNWVYDPSGESGFAFRMDYYVEYIEENSDEMDIIYTMGKSPSWAANYSDEPPENITWWQNYAAVMAERFQGQIKYWEIWNEVDQIDYYGSLDALKILTDSAASVLNAIDPENVVLSPNFTSPQTLANFLRLGGAENVDIISWHHYISRYPEEMIPEIAGVRDVMQRYGVDDKPLWNTEGAVSFMSELSLSAEEQAAAVSRAYLVQWAFGVENFSWYCWDIFGGNTDYVNLSFSATPNQYDSITAAGVAYAQTADWLTGATMESKSVNGGTWVIELSRPGGYQGWVVWRPEGNSIFDVPQAWNIGNIRDLSGTTSPFSGNEITIGKAPLLFESANVTSTEKTRILQFKVYPQPVKNQCVLQWSSLGAASVTIVQPNGKVMERYENITDSRMVLSCENWAPGIYPVVIHFPGQSPIREKIAVAP